MTSDPKPEPAYIVKNISCDRCGLYGSERKFPDIYTPEGEKILRDFGLDLANPSDKERIQTTYAGAICSSCGNFSEFDFNPDNNNKLEQLVES